MERRASFWCVTAPLQTNAAEDESSEGGPEGTARALVVFSGPCQDRVD